MTIPTAFEDIISFLKTAPIRLAVFGEFSCGKSTFLNALIGEKILSVAVEPTTAVPTYIRYAREFNIIVHQTNEDELRLFEKDSAPFWTRFVGRESVLSTLERQKDDIRDFLKQWTKEGEKADLVSKITIELPLPWLKKGIELVDTPGTNVEFTKHQQFTENVSKETDIAILLMDARHGGGKRTEFEFMNTINAAVGKCIVVLNKMDTLDEDERDDIIEFVRTEALPKYWQGTISPKVFGLSALVRFGWEKEKSEPDLAKGFADFLSTIEEMSANERGAILLKHLGNPEQKLFADAQKLEKSGKYDNAHRLYFEIHDILEAAKLDLEPAIRGIERCEKALRNQVQLIEQANTAIISAFEKEALDPDESLTLLKYASGTYSKNNQTDNTVDAAIIRLTARIEKRDNVRKIIGNILAKCRKEHKDRNLIVCCTTMASIHPLLETAELSEEERAAISAEQKRYEEERDSYIATTWNHIKMQIREMDTTHDYSGAPKLIQSIESIQSELGNAVIDQKVHLEAKISQWNNYIQDCCSCLNSIGKLTMQHGCDISDFTSIVDKLRKLTNTYVNLLGISMDNLQTTFNREQRCLITNCGKWKLPHELRKLVHEPAIQYIENDSKYSLNEIDEKFSTRFQFIEQAYAAINTALEKEPVKPDDSLALLKHVSDVFSKHNYTDNAVDTAIMRMTARTEKRDIVRASIENLLLKCRKEYKDGYPIECCTTMASIFPLLETAELSEEEIAAISAEQKRYEEERDKYIAATWNHIEMQIREMDKTHDYSDAPKLIQSIESIKSQLGKAEIAQKDHLEKKLSQWNNYLQESNDCLVSIGKLAERHRSSISDFTSTADKLQKLALTYNSLFDIADDPFQPDYKRGQQYLATNDDKWKLLHALRKLTPEFAISYIENRSKYSFDTIDEKFSIRAKELSNVHFRGKKFRNYPDHPEYGEYLRALINFRPGILTTLNRSLNKIEEIKSNRDSYAMTINLNTLIAEWLSILNENANKWANITIIIFTLSISSLIVGISIKPENSFLGKSTLITSFIASFLLLLIGSIPIILYSASNCFRVVKYKLTIGAFREFSAMATLLVDKLEGGWQVPFDLDFDADEGINKIFSWIGGVTGAILGFSSGLIGVIIGALGGAFLGVISIVLIKAVGVLIVRIVSLLFFGTVISVISPFTYTFGIFTSRLLPFGIKDNIANKVEINSNFDNNSLKTDKLFLSSKYLWECTHCGAKGIDTIKKCCPNCGEPRKAEIVKSLTKTTYYY